MNLKKLVYIILTVFLGGLIGFIVYELFLIGFIKIQLNQNILTEYNESFGILYNSKTIFVFLIVTLLGAVGGFLTGLKWWKIVYVEHRHWVNFHKDYKNKKSDNSYH